MYNCKSGCQLNFIDIYIQIVSEYVTSPSFPIYISTFTNLAKFLANHLTDFEDLLNNKSRPDILNK